MVKLQISNLLTGVRFSYPAEYRNKRGAGGAAFPAYYKLLSAYYLTASFNALAARNFAVREAAI